MKHARDQLTEKLSWIPFGRRFGRNGQGLLLLEHLPGAASFVLAAKVGRALVNSLNERKSIVGKAHGDEARQLPGMVGRAPGNIAGPGCPDEFAKIEGAINVAVWSRSGQAARRGEGGVLPAGHSVNAVVEGDGGDADVSPGGMD